MTDATFYMIAIALSILIGVFCGWRGARDMPQNVREFVISSLWVLAWTAAWVFLAIVVLLASTNPFSMGQLVQNGGWFTLASAMLWIPAAKITYVIRALRLRQA